MTFEDDISFLEMFRARILQFLIVGAAPTQDPLWGGRGLIDMREAMKQSEFRDLRRDINKLKGRAAEILNDLGVVTTFHQYLPPAVGGPIVKYPLFDLITDNRSQHSIDGAIFTDKLDEAIGLLQYGTADPAARPSVNAPEGSSELGPAIPVFLVGDVSASLEFYEQKLGFTGQTWPLLDKSNAAMACRGPNAAMVCRGNVKIMLKEAGSGVDPLPPSTRLGALAWDVYLSTRDPKALEVEFAARGLTIHKPIDKMRDGQCGFCITDLNGYVLFFGDPLFRGDPMRRG